MAGALGLGTAAQRISRTAEVWEAAVGAINAQYGTSHGVNVRMRGGMYLQVAGGKPAPQPVPGVLQCLGRTPGGRLRWRLPLLPALSAYGAPYNHFRSPPSGSSEPHMTATASDRAYALRPLVRVLQRRTCDLQAPATSLLAGTTASASGAYPFTLYPDDWSTALAGRLPREVYDHVRSELNAAVAPHALPLRMGLGRLEEWLLQPLVLCFGNPVGGGGQGTAHCASAWPWSPP
eukprot:XP_001703108.1 predicted protein [Chlamydomonas reinhardtii]